ncbi:MAG: hypothetical protein LBP67_09165 [Bacteroidales bacterium]|jgi:hypothetical protein|nr:hypothetical protein [Bacteroidales bacterium]
MKKLLKILPTLFIVILISSCTSQEDIENFIGNYEGSYHGYQRLTFGYSYEQEDFSGEETFSIIYNDDESGVLLLMDDQVIPGKVRNKKVKFETYTITTVNEENNKANTNYTMEAKLKNGELRYGTIIEGTAVVGNSILPIDGFIEGKAKKVN